MMNKVKGFKAFDKGLVCRGLQYKEGEQYQEKAADLCKAGFHFCENPLDVLDYYDLTSSEFATVEAAGKIESDGKKSVTNKIKIQTKLELFGFIKAAIEFIWKKCKYDKENGDSSQLAASGDYSKLAASGDSSKLAASGHSSQLAASGDYSKLAASGDYSKLAASGHSSQLALNGGYSVGACVGHGSKIKGKIGCWITLAEWGKNDNTDKWTPICVKSAQIDGEILKEDVFYKLENGEFVEIA
jgi:hypothetical protein